jgi:hypothetical protein
MAEQPFLESLFEIKSGFIPAELLPLNKKRSFKTIP